MPPLFLRRSVLGEDLSCDCSALAALQLLCATYQQHKSSFFLVKFTKARTVRLL